MTSDQAEKIRENRYRRALRRRGLELTKSRRRDPMALDYNRYQLLRDGAVIAETTGLDGVQRWVETGNYD